MGPTIANAFSQVFPYIKSALEICVLAILIYSVFYYLRGTRGAPILAGIVSVLLLMAIAADYLNFEIIGWLLEQLWTFFGIALIVIFQPEFRRAFAQIGSRSFMRGIRRQEAINELVAAVINMAARRVGALIAVEQAIGMRAFTSDATQLDAKLTHQLLETIFFPNTPLHDGGVIVKDGRVVAAHCIFPLSTDEDVRSLGTRHRAALGVSEETDAVVIVVSEETGGISIAFKGNLKRHIRPDRLRRFLNMLLSDEKGKSFKELLDEVGEESENNGGFVA